MPETDKNSFAQNVRTVFLDRDGVINEKMPEGQWVQSVADFYVLPGVPDAVARLNRAGIRVIVVTNQRGIALGLFTAADVKAIQSGFQAVLQSHGAHVDAFYFCPHDRNACNCRKPLPGMFEQACKDSPEISAQTSVMIGDSLGDIEFGRRLGMMTIFIDGDSGQQKPGVEQARELANLRCKSLSEAVDALLKSR